MKTVFAPEFIEDLRYWGSADRRTAIRILTLIDHVGRDPAAGIGKPEALKHLGPGVWSRRVTQEHRLVYRVTGDEVHVLQARYHY